ncbi:hypothetical protein O0B29_02215 [Staphylococcus pseudintermedius]|nr:hypothetical protein [Staphylococcus pseudintermedius]
MNTEKTKNLYLLHREIAVTLTEFFDKCEEALFSGENLENTLEHIGLKCDELLQKM